MADTSFYVGPWLIEPTINRMSEGHHSVRVEPKLMDVLVMLGRHPGQVVTRDQLFEEVWAGTIVTDDVLTRSVSELRKVFGDDPKQSTFIETIPRTGYRLIASVSSSPPSEPVLVSSVDVPLKSRFGLAAIVALAVLAAMWAKFGKDEVPRRVLNPTPVTTYPGPESRPALSPDGKQVAFSWRGEEVGNVDLYVKYVDAAPVLRLTDDPEPNVSPTWSPDGTEIAFIRRDSACTIQIVSAIGGVPRAVGSCGASIYADLTWSPDGAWLAFNDRTSSSESFAIHLMASATGKKHRLTNPPTGIWGDHDPTFSPDGASMSFVRSASEGMQEVYTINIGGDDEQQLTFEGRNVWSSAWMPDGRELVISSNRTGRPGLWKVDASGGPLKWLGVQSPAAGFPTIAGNRLAFLQIDTDVNLWRIPLNGSGNSRVFAPSTYWDLHPGISPDGSQVAFSTNRSGSYEIWLADSAGGSLRQVTAFGGPFTSTPRWSPDGTRFVFTGRSDGQADVYVMGLNSSGPTQITTSEADDLAPAWSQDGSRVLLTSNRSGKWETWSIARDGGEAKQETFSGSFGARAHPDGRSLVFSRPSDPGLWALDTSTGKEVEIVAGTDPRDWGSWDIAGTGLYYVYRGIQTHVLRHDLGTGAVDTVATAASRVPAMDPALAVSPDERWLLLGQVDRQESDIMVVEIEVGIRK